MGSFGTASEEELLLTKKLFWGIFDSLSQKVQPETMFYRIFIKISRHYMQGKKKLFIILDSWYYALFFLSVLPQTQFPSLRIHLKCQETGQYFPFIPLLHNKIFSNLVVFALMKFSSVCCCFLHSVF